MRRGMPPRNGQIENRGIELSWQFMKILKRIFKWIGIVLGLFLVFGIFQIGWGIYREPIAKKLATDFCAGINVGQSTDGIAERAIASGAEARLARWSLEPDGTSVLLVTYIGMPPFSRHMCTIRATTVVVSSEYDHMD